MISADLQIIDLTHDTRYLYTRARTDGIKAVLGGFAGGKQVSKSTSRYKKSQLICLF